MKAIVYGRTKPFCQYCVMAKELLASKDIPFVFVEVGTEISIAELQELFPGAQSVPQIILDDVKLQGGYSTLKATLG